MARTALVVGASRGIGEALALHYLRRGWRVIGVSRSRSAALEREASKDASGQLIWHQADLSHPDVEDVLEETAQLVANRDDPAGETVAFINAAQLSPIGVAGALGHQEIADGVGLNLVMPISLTHRLIRQHPAGGGLLRMVLVSSGASQHPMPGLGVYGATKAGINAFVASTQAELDRMGRGEEVKIWAVSPGIVDTAMQAQLRSQAETALPDRATYQDWHASGTLASATEAAAKLVSVLDRDDIRPGSYVHARALG